MNFVLASTRIPTLPSPTMIGEKPENLSPDEKLHNSANIPHARHKVNPKQAYELLQACGEEFSLRMVAEQTEKFSRIPYSITTIHEFFTMEFGPYKRRRLAWNIIRETVEQGWPELNLEIVIDHEEGPYR